MPSPQYMPKPPSTPPWLTPAGLRDQEFDDKVRPPGVPQSIEGDSHRWPDKRIEGSFWAPPAPRPKIDIFKPPSNDPTEIIEWYEFMQPPKDIDPGFYPFGNSPSKKTLFDFFPHLLPPRAREFRARQRARDAMLQLRSR